MSYSVEGDYFETCNCTVACQCIMLSPATNDPCQAFYASQITIEKTNGKRHVKVGKVLEMDSEELKGMDGKTAPVISNPLLGVVPQPVRVAKAGRIRYEGAWNFEGSGSNGFTTEFKYEA